MRDLALATLGWLMVWAPLMLMFGLSILALRQRKPPAEDPMQTAHLNEAWGDFPYGDVK